jgi:hypothetical protein
MMENKEREQNIKEYKRIRSRTSSWFGAKKAAIIPPTVNA